MRALLVIAAIAIVALPATAQVTCCYSWEDGGTVLGVYGANVINVTNVTGSQPGQAGDQGTWTCPGAYDLDNYLHVAESPHSGTPQIYIAWITGLVAGDVVEASFWAYDDIESDYYGYPSARLWGHYATDTDIDDYQGSAGSGSGGGAYTSGIGWEELSSSWVCYEGSPYAGATSLVIEFRLYSSPATADPMTTDYWADYVCITAPATACINVPTAVSPVEDSSWSTIKALYR
jgi:hypothetical protein